ncbi:hypothetical protein PE143B_0119685 [Pseudomonas extremaustralis 14-3 substr. 14-3b]|nr:hypothetical protein PE143B_0119685 [Pseudomonas extremaustralis 14-3 substr. 14-3b]
MHPQLTGRVHQALVGERLGKNRQAVATALGQGAIGVDDQQVKRWLGLERSDQQPIAAVSLGLRRAWRWAPLTFAGDSRRGPRHARTRRVGSADGHINATRA